MVNSKLLSDPLSLCQFEQDHDFIIILDIIIICDRGHQHNGSPSMINLPKTGFLDAIASLELRPVSQSVTHFKI